MRKFGIFALSAVAVLGACSKSDPILPGTRESIFPATALTYANADIANLPENAYIAPDKACPYTQDSSNIIWSGKKKIFSGFPTNNSVKSDQKPICDGGFVFAGLTTGELVKINPKNRQIVWIADIYRPSNMTGGAAVLDIVAPIVIKGSDIYAGGLGDAFCKLNKTTGATRWCVNIGTSTPYIITDAAVFVLGINKTLYAVNNKDGKIYWATQVKGQSAPVYKDKIITVGKQKIDAINGKIIK